MDRCVIFCPALPGTGVGFMLMSFKKKKKTKQELGELLLSFFLCPGNSLNNI